MSAKAKARITGFLIILSLNAVYFYFAFNTEVITIVEGGLEAFTTGVSSLVSTAVVLISTAVFLLFAVLMNYIEYLIDSK